MGEGHFLSLEQQVFLVESRAVVELMIERTVEGLEEYTEEELHVMLLDDAYEAHEVQGVATTGFQNALAAAILIAAIERKKGKS